jgi:hypothetical protein
MAQCQDMSVLPRIDVTDCRLYIEPVTPSQIAELDAIADQ